jgi:two component, sigma54 specific, transcriptional regulator, Fis family
MRIFRGIRPTYLVNKISPAAMELLVRYHWPGNIRELQNVIERAAIICQGNEILPEHLPKELLAAQKTTAGPVINFPDLGISLEEVEKELILKALEKTGGNQTRAAQLLSNTRSALFYQSQNTALTTFKKFFSKKGGFDPYSSEYFHLKRG